MKNIRDSISSAIWNEVMFNIPDDVRAQFDDAAWHKVWNDVRRHVQHNARATVMMELEKRIKR